RISAAHSMPTPPHRVARHCPSTDQTARQVTDLGFRSCRTARDTRSHASTPGGYRTSSVWSLASHTGAGNLAGADEFPDRSDHVWHAGRRHDQLVDRPEVSTVAGLTGVLPSREKPAHLVDGEDRQRPAGAVRQVDDDVNIGHRLLAPVFR